MSRKRAFESPATASCKKSLADTSDILFYSTVGAWGFLSNFSRHPLFVDGLVYPTSEHYYQAQKCPAGSSFAEKIRKCTTPTRAAALGRSQRCPKVPNWDDIKLQVMEKALKIKLAQHPDLSAKLLESGSRHLVEASPKDSFWGWGKDKNGENHLGKLWMKIREEEKLSLSRIM